MDGSWIEEEIAKFITEYGAVPPPWFIFPETHPYDLIWRMGAGESHLMVFGVWWEKQKENLDETQRISYFRAWPPPPRWLTWMLDVIWDLNPLEMEDPESFDYSPYFSRIEGLGFGTQEDYERDLNDPKWISESE